MDCDGNTVLLLLGGKEKMWHLCACVGVFVQVSVFALPDVHMHVI